MIKNNMHFYGLRILTSIFSLLLFINLSKGQQSFTQGNLVVLQTINTATKSSSQITLKEITPSGASGITVSIPSGIINNYPLQTSGIYGGSEGFLSTSTDGRYLVLGGYASSSTIADITATPSTTYPRAIGIVTQSGAYAQIDTSKTFFNSNDIRGAISDGSHYWASGASAANIDGIDYYGPGIKLGLGTGTVPPKAYGLRIFNGNIYYSTQKAGPVNTATQLGIFQFGTGLPTSGSVTVSQIINTGTAIPQDFSFNPAMNVCYIAINLNTAVGGIQKWIKSGSTWSLAYTLGTGFTNIGAYGLIVDYSGSNPVIYTTTYEAAGNRVIKITDTGSGSTATTLVSAVAGVFNKGITFSPVDAGIPIVNLYISTNSGSETATTAITVTAIASSVVSTTQTVSLNVSGTGITSSDYNLTNNTITIPAGSSSGTVTFTVANASIYGGSKTAILTLSNPTSGLQLGTMTSQHIVILDDANAPPSISMNVTTTSNYIDGGVVVSPASPYVLSSVIGDLTDPASTSGIDFIVNDLETSANLLIVTAVSSNQAVVPNANLIITGTGAIRNVKITPTGVGYSDITISVFDGVNTTSYIIAYAASVRTPDIIPLNTHWHTGMSDASDAIAIDNNYYISGDDEYNVLNVYSRHASGLPVVSFNFSTYLSLPDPAHPEADIEAATRSTTVSNKMYWSGSMSNGASPFPNKPNRDRLFATTITGTGASTTFTFAGYVNLRSSLLAWGDTNGYAFTASSQPGIDSKTEGGLSLEGMVFGPDNTTLYLGMRAPLVPITNRNNALIAPILNFESWFNNGNPVGNPTYGSPIELNLNHRGIRDIERLSNGTYIIIAGDVGDSTFACDFYKWTGYPSDEPILVPSAGNVLKMEGIMPIDNGSGQSSLTQLQVVTDGGDVVLYNDGFEAKDLSSGLRKFRSDIITGLDLNICTGFVASISTNGYTTICSGDTVTLTATAGNGNNIYLWSNGATTSSIKVTTANNYSVTVTNVTSECIANANQTVNVNTLQTPTVTAVAACGHTILTATNYTGSLLWSTSDTTVSITVNDGNTYTVTQSLNGCISASASGSMTPIPLNNETVSITSLQGANVIAGTSVTFTTTTTGNVLPTDLKWYINNIYTGSTGTSFTYIPLNGDLVKAGIDQIACNSGATSNTISMIVTSYLSTIWTGSINNDWSNSGNWTNGVPAYNYNVTIPGNITNMPTITSSGICHDFTLLNNATIIDNNNNLNITGSVEADRSLSPGVWHFIGSPVLLAYGYAFSGDNPDNGTGVNKDTLYLYKYDEPTNTYPAITIGNTEKLYPGNGYEIWSTKQVTIKLKGVYGNQLQSLQDTLKVTYTPTSPKHGMNLVANPFPCAISLDNSATWQTNMNPTIQTWDPIAKVYKYKSGTGISTIPGNLIPSYQGFFVFANAASPKMIIPTSAKTNAPASFMKASIPDVLHLTVNGNNYKDETFINFNTNATAGFDDQLDVEKLLGAEEVPQFYSVLSNMNLAVNVLHDINSNPLVQMGFNITSAGIYTITASELSSFAAGTSIKLEDTKLNTFTDLIAQPEYSFNADANDNANRFKVHFGAPNGIINNNGNGGINIYSNNNTVYINNQGTEKIKDIVVYDLLGKELLRKQASNSTVNTLDMQFASAYYMIKVITNSNVYTKKVYVK
ncbi:MAG: T9SS type A sorting domain-containing protein [Bacteroidota bacterium]